MDSIFSVGGVQRVTAVIAKELAKTCDVTIVTFDKPDDKDTSLYGLDEATINYRFFHYPRITKIDKFFHRLYSAYYRKGQPKCRQASDLYGRSSFPSVLRYALVKELRQGHYDCIVGVHAPLAARLATLMPQLPGVRCVGWIHNSFEALFGNESHYLGPQLKRHYVYQFRKLHATILLCQHDADSYRAYDKHLQPTVIYNPLTLQPGTPATGTTKRFLAVGRFTPGHKGFDLLIDAFHLFAQQDSEWVLDIVGEGPEETLYRSKITEYHLEERVLLHPFTNHIQDYYSQAQVYVLSSRWEGFGLVLVEAMAHGLPVISSDLPTSQEIMGDFGMYFSNGDIQTLAQRLLEARTIDWPAKSKVALAMAKKFDIQAVLPAWKRIIT